MKKHFLIFVFFIFGFSFFAETGKAEEIGHFLFLPNSSNLFANEEQAIVQLDNLAKTLMDRNLHPGQIVLLGYAAIVDNDIEPVDLSRDRTLFVMNELNKRGISKEFFAEPEAHGSVDLWGSDTSEEVRSLNRRVTIMLDAGEKKVQSEYANEYTIGVSIADKMSCVFPWKKLLPLILIPIIAALIYFLLKNRKSKAAVQAPAAEPQKQTEETVIDLSEEISRRAYELYLQRLGQSENAYEDWLRAVTEVCAKYKANGYKTSMSGRHWQAIKKS